MVEYFEALKRPFEDARKLIIGIILSIIPIVNFIFYGYLLDVAETGMRKQKKLPEFEGFGRLFVNGFKMLLIGIVYLIPVALVMGILFFTGLATVPSMESLTSASLSALGGFGLSFIVTAIVALVFGYLSTGAVLRFAEKKELSAAFELKEIADKVFTGTFFVGWLITVVLAGAISVVLGLIPVVGTLFTVYISGVFGYTALGQAYSEA